MRRFLITSICLLALSATVVGQETGEKSARFSPKAGDWSIGFSFNPVSLAYKQQLQPKAGTFAGAYIQELGSNNKQMFILSQDPLAAFRFKYHFTESWALRVTLGVNGSNVNYREYVQDDAAKMVNPLSENKVADQASSHLNGGSLIVGAERKFGKGALKFVTGFGVMYSIAGGTMSFKYGNVLNEYNQAPSTMPMLEMPSSSSGTATESLNEFDSVLGITYGRPLKRANVNYVQGIGVSVDMGVEWFCFDRMSIGGALTFTPFMFMWQPQTYTIFEGFSNITGKVEQYNKLVSPGSSAVLYGTENIGFSLSLNYYF